MTQAVEFTIERANVLEIQADVVAFKYAQTFHGADSVAGKLLDLDWSLTGEGPIAGEARLLQTHAKLGAPLALFVGTPRLGRLGYPEIRELGKSVLKALREEAPQVATLALTVHGPGFGLDERECFDAQLAGLMDAMLEGDYPRGLRRIVFAELDQERAEVFAGRLTEIFPQAAKAKSADEPRMPAPAAPGPAALSALRTLDAAGLSAEAKRSILVAMPFDKSVRSLYRYGIYGPAESAGYVCERADHEVFTGDVMQWLQARIQHASLVIGEVTEPNPNVYLEVGYAWALQKPLLLVAKQGTKLPFDIQGQKCLFYEDIVDLEERLREMLARMQ